MRLGSRIGSKPATYIVALTMIAGACKDEPEAAPAPEEAEPAAEPQAETPAVVQQSADTTPLEPPPSGHVVVEVGARLYLSATGQDAIDLPKQLPGDPPGVTFAAMGRAGDRWIVETLSGEHQCAGELDGLRGLRLRLYVDKNHVLEVTKAPVVHEFADGTRIELGSGVPLVPAEPGSHERVADADGARVTLPIERDRIGRHAEPGKAFEPGGEAGRLVTDPAAALRYGDRRELPEDRLYDGGNLRHYGMTTRDGDALVTVRNACLQATVRTEPYRVAEVPEFKSVGILGTLRAESEVGEALGYGGAFAAATDEDVWGGLTGTEIGEAYGVGGLGLIGTGGSGIVSTEWVVRPGTAALWADGEIAGQVLAQRRFYAEPKIEGDNSCFEVGLTRREESTITLCFATAEIEQTASAMATIGLGTIGALGSGSGSGSGFGHGSGSVGISKPPPKVTVAKPTTAGSLDKDIIRRIVRAHINEVRFCYNKELTKDPSVEGKVTVAFTIDGSGNVSVASVDDNTTGNTDLGDCVVKAVKRWRFPKPTGGGVVTVKYPFVLKTGE